jgi:outer membrane protein
VGPYLRLGSLELAPVNLLVQLSLPVGSTRPYLGAGMNVTPAWEKSGFLDSLDVTASVGPAFQVGADFGLSPTMVFNVDAKWNAQRTGVSAAGTRLVTLQVDPLLLSTGIGFRF